MLVVSNRIKTISKKIYDNTWSLRFLIFCFLSGYSILVAMSLKELPSGTLNLIFNNLDNPLILVCSFIILMFYCVGTLSAVYAAKVKSSL